MEEIWKDIKFIDIDGKEYNYAGFYQVSNYGRVRSLDRIDSKGRILKGRIMKCKPNNSGYLQIMLSKDNIKQRFYIHRLVAHMFIPNPENSPVVNHLDENPSNCNVDNLEWCSQEHNVQYSSYKKKGKQISKEHKFKISESHKGHKNPKAKKVICLETLQVFGCTVEASEWCGGNVSMCCRGRNKTAGGYHWQFLDDYLREQRMQSDIKNSKLVA